MYFSQTRAPRATPELPAPAQQTSSRPVTATNDRPRVPALRASVFHRLTDVQGAQKKAFCAHTKRVEQDRWFQPSPGSVAGGGSSWSMRISFSHCSYRSGGQARSQTSSRYTSGDVTA